MRYTPKRSKKSRTYWYIVRIIAIAILVIMLFIFVGIPKNDSETELTVESPKETPMTTPTLEITPTPIPEPTTEITPTPIPEPTTKTISTITPTPMVAPTIEITPTPTPTPIPEPTTEMTPTITRYYTEEDVINMAKVMYNEARGIGSITQIACVGWVACNRVDAGIFGDTITDVLTAPNQFAWIPNTPVEERLVKIAEDVLYRWSVEKSTGECYGRVLPAEYLYFHGDGKANWFRIKYKHNGQYWNYSLPSPYES